MLMCQQAQAISSRRGIMTTDDARTAPSAQATIGADTARLSRRTMLRGSGAMFAALGLAGVTGFGKPQSASASEQERTMSERHGTDKPRIVLVHGAWADGTGWQHIIPLLEDDGYPVIAVQNPLSSFADDIATTKRVIDSEAQKGSVVVVGHSYGGAAISGAADNPNVKALVYLAAFAPDAGEPVGALLGQFPPTPLGAAFVEDTAGFVYIDRAKFREIFAGDVNRTEVRVMAAAQKPASGTIFGQSAGIAAWRTAPSWYLVSKQDQTLHPDMQRFYAQRMGATTQEIDASHVAYISRPKEVAKFIKKAAKAVS
jgi:pimeloyl-ACP methyl ester carboxylesterase